MGIQEDEKPIIKTNQSCFFVFVIIKSTMDEWTFLSFKRQKINEDNIF